MARTRNIKPAFFDNDTLGSLDPLIRLLFIGLWCIADREGRLEDRPRRIKKTLLGYDDCTTEEVGGMLQQLADNDFIIRYEVDGIKYIQVTTFSKHQNPNMKEKESEIPPPPGFDAKEKRAPNKYSASTVPIPSEEEDGTEGAPSEEEHPTVQETRFNTFWAAYPNKKAKQNALKAWRKIKPSAELFDKIMKAVELQKRSEDWRREGGRFIPHPASWLNAGRWDDEIKEVSNSGEDRQPTGNGDVGSGFPSRKGGSGTPDGFKSE